MRFFFLRFWDSQEDLAQCGPILTSVWVATPLIKIHFSWGLSGALIFSEVCVCARATVCLLSGLSSGSLSSQ